MVTRQHWSRRTSERAVSGRLFSSNDRALAAKKREHMVLVSKLEGISQEEQYSRRIYNLQRMKLTKELFAMDKSAKQFRRDSFDASRYPFWDPESDQNASNLRQLPKIRPFTVADPVPSTLYGEVIERTIYIRQPSAATEYSRRFSSSTLMSTSPEHDSPDCQEYSMMDEIKKIKEEACARKPSPKPRGDTVNKFVNEFEWLDTKHSRWYIEKMTKLFHEKLLEEMRAVPKEKRSLYFTRTQTSQTFRVPS